MAATAIRNFTGMELCDEYSLFGLEAPASDLEFLVAIEERLGVGRLVIVPGKESKVAALAGGVRTVGSPSVEGSPAILGWRSIIVGSFFHRSSGRWIQ